MDWRESNGQDLVTLVRYVAGIKQRIANLKPRVTQAARAAGHGDIPPTELAAYVFTVGVWDAVPESAPESERRLWVTAWKYLVASPGALAEIERRGSCQAE